MEIMDKNENVTNGQLSEKTLEKLGGLRLKLTNLFTMKTTWADLSPSRGRGRNIMNDCLTGHVLNDNHVGQTTQNDNSTTASTSNEVIDNRITLENGPVIKFCLNTLGRRTEQQHWNTLGGRTEDRHAMTLPKRSSKKTRTWKDLSPTKDKSKVYDNMMSCSCGSTPRSKSYDSDGNAKELVTWKDMSPPLSPTKSGKFLKYSAKEKKSESVVKRSPEHRGRQRRRPESGYYSNDVQGESREGFDSSLSGSDIGNVRSGVASSPEDGCNEYFYDEDFIVQFDTNIRDGSVPPELSDHEPLPFPQSLTGSYTRFAPLQDSFSQANIFLGHYESELSGSRTSMEISSSEREMMCSSDLLDFSNDPLFTPTPTSEAVAQHFSIDSLGRGSGSVDLAVDCCPKKEEYFLSFDASQGRFSVSGSERSYSSQTSSSQEEPQTVCGLSGSGSTGEETEDVCSSSFHYCHVHYASQKGVNHHCRPLGQRSRGHRARANSMGSLPERSIEKSLSDAEKGHRCSPGSSRSLDRSCMSSPTRSSTCYRHSSLGSVGNSVNSLQNMQYSSESAQRRHNITSWKRVKNLQKFGILENMLTNELYNSLPNLVDQTPIKRTRRKFNDDLQSMADSFHNKRHSASLLEMYQRMKTNSNPVSPNTMNTVECILFPQNGLSDDEKLCVSRSGLDTCGDSEDCGCGKRGLKLDLDKGEVTTPRYSETSSSSGLRTLTPSQKTWSTASTAISPDTLVFWHGTKNFAAQFPPRTKDCGIQTSLVEDENMTNYQDHSMQTSPNSPRSDFLSVFNDVCGHQSRTPHKTESMGRRRECVSEYRERNTSGSKVKRSKSLSPSRMGYNSFYTFQSLPDLSFLSTANFDEEFSPQSSLFDPVKIPIILTPVVDDSKQTQSRDGSYVCSCQKEKKGKPRPYDIASSSSGFSTSSSSGIDPGYYDSHRCCTSLAADLERLLFLPPHLESNPKFPAHKCGIPSSRSEGFKPERKCGHYSGNRHQRAAQIGGRSEHLGGRSDHESYCDRCGDSLRYENEIGRYNMSKREVELCRRELHLAKRLSNSTSSSLSSFHLDGLYSVKEASPTSETADSGPDFLVRQHSETYLDEMRNNYEEMDRDMDDTDMIGHIYEQLSRDRKPLKSCLRKKRDFKARSLSIPDSYNVTAEQKPPKKPSRYSIACDGVFPQLVSDEHFENANIQLPPPDQREEISAIREDVMISSSSSSSFEEGNFSKKSVSFASEVSFHSPQYSPKHVNKQRTLTQTVSSLDLQDETLTLQIIEQQDVNTTETKTLKHVSPASSDEMLNNSCEREFIAETTRKRSILLCVTQAAEALVEHFAHARDPFDKLRLGSSAESPDVAMLVVSRLCPALEMVIEEGMKPYLTGFHVFGKIHITSWRVAEMSSELGPYTRAVNDLVRKLKLSSSLVTNKQKFYAFIIGLVNLRLLDFWMGYVRSKKDIISRVYETHSILCLSESSLKHHYDNMLLALQPLAVLPFQLEFEIVCPSSALDSSINSSLESHNLSHSLDLNRPIRERKADHSQSQLISKGQGQSEKVQGETLEKCQSQTEKGHDQAEKGQGQNSEKGQTPAWSWFGGATFPRTKRLLSGFNTGKSENKENNSAKNAESSKSKFSDMENVFSAKLTKDLENIEVKEKLSKVGEKPSNGGQVSPFTNLAQKFLQRTQSQDCAQTQNTMTSSLQMPNVTVNRRRQSMDGFQSAASPSQSQSQSFNLISFFDKLLLPEKQAKNQRTSWIADAQVDGGNLCQEESKSLPVELNGCSSPRKVERNEKQQEENGNTQEDSCEKVECGSGKVKDKYGYHDDEKEIDYREYFLEPRLECERTMLDFETSDSPSEASSIQLEADVGDKLGVCYTNRSEGKLNISETKDTFLDESSQDEDAGAGGGEGLACSQPIIDDLTNSQPIIDDLTNGQPIIDDLTNGQPIIDDLTNGQQITDDLTNGQQITDDFTNGQPITEDLTNDPPIRNVGVDAFSGVDINANSPSFQHNTYAIVLPSPVRHSIQSEPRMQFKTFHPQLSSFKPSPSHSSKPERPSLSGSQSEVSSQQTSVENGQLEKSLDGAKEHTLEAKSIRKDSFGMTSFKHAMTLVSHQSEDPNELSFDHGDYLEVLAQLDDDWLFCANGKREGRVKITEVRQLSEEETFEKLHDNFYY